MNFKISKRIANVLTNEYNISERKINAFLKGAILWQQNQQTFMPELNQR